VVLLFFGTLLAPARVLMVRDIPMFHLPLRRVWSSLLRQGWPLWNPMIHGGQPILSNPNYAAFYPPTWLALAVPAHYALGLIVVLHAAWAFAGAFGLARRLGCRASSSLFAAIAFVGGGAFVALPNNLTLYCGLAWLPWVLAWGELALHGSSREARTRGSVLAGAAVGAQLLSGEPYSPVLGALALGCLALGGGAPWRRRAGGLLAIFAIAALLGAAQWIPTLHHLADSPRSAGLSDRDAMTWSTRPDRLVEWWFPNLRGDPSRNDRGFFFGQDRHDRGAGYLPSIYVGQLVLLLAAAALVRPGIPRRATWIALIVAGVALALGRHDPLYAGLLVRVPPFSLLRYPEKFLLLATSGLAFAAALGWEDLLRRRDSGSAGVTTTPLRIGVLALAVAGAILVLPWVRPELARDLIGGSAIDPGAQTRRLAYLGSEAAVTFGLALGSLAVLALHRSRRIRAGALAAVVLLFVLADLYRVERRFVVTARATDVFAPPSAVASLPRPDARLWTDQLFFPDAAPEAFDVDRGSSIPRGFIPGREQLQPYWANLWGVPYALNEDYDLMLTSPARHALGILRTHTHLLERGWNDSVMAYLGAWNACNVARRRTPDALRDEFSRTGVRPERVRVLPNPFCLDRYRFVARAERDADLATATARVAERAFAVGELEALVAPRTGDLAPRTYAAGRVSSVEERGARIDLGYDAAGDALLVAAVTYDRGWRGEVDGRSVPVLMTALGQMAIEVPAGSHRLRLRYRDPWVAIGVAITAAAIAGGVAPILIRLRRSRAPAAPPSPRE
jgi:hypothetical protein